MRAIFSNLFLGRFFAAIVVVFATYNIWGTSYYHWVRLSPFEGITDPTGFLKLLVGFALVLAYAFFVWAGCRAPAKLIYLGLIAMVVGVLFYLNLSGYINLRDPNVGTIIAQVVLAFTLALGSIWSHVWFGRTGQRAIDDPDTGGEFHHH